MSRPAATPVHVTAFQKWKSATPRQKLVIARKQAAARIWNTLPKRKANFRDNLDTIPFRSAACGAEQP